MLGQSGLNIFQRVGVLDDTVGHARVRGIVIPAAPQTTEACLN